MSKLRMVTEKEAQGEFKDMFHQIKSMMEVEVPPTFQIAANDPEYLRLVIQKMAAVIRDGEIDKKMKYAIGLVVSIMNNCEPCITMYADKLKMDGFTDKQILEIISIIDLVSAMNHFHHGAICKSQGFN